MLLLSQPLPRKGTETHTAEFRTELLEQTFATTTPQGDGNFRNRKRSSVAATIDLSQPLPRKGTETLTYMRQIFFMGGITFATTTPQGDGNCLIRVVNGSNLSQPLPRKGTETPYRT